MSDYYDRQGRPLSMEQWTTLRIDKRIARTETEGCTVSTVWLGLDHQYGDGPPLIFETMVFGGGLDEFCERWATEDEARAGHDRIVEQVRREADIFRATIADPEVRAAAAVLLGTVKAYRDVVGGWSSESDDLGRFVAAITAAEARP